MKGEKCEGNEYGEKAPEIGTPVTISIMITVSSIGGLFIFQNFCVLKMPIELLRKAELIVI